MMCKTKWFLGLAMLVACSMPARADGLVTRPAEEVEPAAGDATARIQAAIDRVFKAGGGTVSIARGEYRLGAIRLRSRVTLYLQSGAKLIAERDPNRYFILDDDVLEPVDPKLVTREAWILEHSCSLDNFTRYPGSRWNNGLIRLYRAEDAAIIGEKGSEIDGANPYDPVGEEFYRGPHGVSAIGCRNLVLRGYTIRNTGNWAHRIADTQGLVVENLTVLAGHDAVHVNGCDDVRIADCVFKTGDDCVAGFDNERVVVENCYLNTACSGFRFAGYDVLIRKCTLKGPAEYGFRGSLSEADKAAGAPSGKAFRNNMLSFFTYYSDGTHPVRRAAGKIRIVDCTSDDTDRFIHYNYGNEAWQRGKPMTDIVFERVRATRLKLPFSAWSDAGTPVSLTFRNCAFAFSVPPDAFIRGGNVREIVLDGVTVEGVGGSPLFRNWSAVEPKVNGVNVKGVGLGVCKETGTYRVQAI